MVGTVSSWRSKLHGGAKADVRPHPHSTYGVYNDTIALVKDQFVSNFNITSKIIRYYTKNYTTYIYMFSHQDYCFIKSLFSFLRI